ncbi:hypothetical protein GTP27_22920 [Pseudoduganella sp. CY13W]|uniref:Uncharacterized protein n=1 Tax=Duganella qianjiadongensis TaxID=2692176 RepID=A0ABW9VSW1_9BURK|nr:hypothetical protein [Duganella qianjiadongensis]
MKNLGDLKSLFLACALLLSGCVTATKPVPVDAVTFFSSSSNDTLTAIEVAKDIASIFPDLSHAFIHNSASVVGRVHFS